MGSESANQHKEINVASARMLHQALGDTHSTYGFIGPVIEGGPQGHTLRVLADEGFSWDPKVNRALYDKVRADYSELGYIDFPYLDNLFGCPIRLGTTIIANEPQSDQRRSGRTPAGHPPLDNFLGVPIMHGDNVVGAIGLANRAGGYSDRDRIVVEAIGAQGSALYEFYRRGIKQVESERRQRETEKYNEELVQRLLDLTYNVSHELQGPCRTLESYLRLLSARYKDRLGKDADDFIDNSLHSAGLITRIVDDLWTYARIDSATNHVEQLELGAIASAAVASLGSFLQERNAEVVFADLPSVVGVKRQIVYLFEQLIRNGVLFNDSSKPRVEILSQRIVDETVLEFKDNGVGFDTVELPEKLKMFRKTKGSEGTGMGLAIVQSIVKYHGGRISAESEIGAGSSWFIVLPDERFGWENKPSVAS